jgi:hypothetical protein
MLWLAVILFVAWLLGFVVFHVAGGLIHILLVIAIVVFIFTLLSGRRSVCPASGIERPGGVMLPGASDLVPRTWCLGPGASDPALRTRPAMTLRR